MKGGIFEATLKMSKHVGGGSPLVKAFTYIPIFGVAVEYERNFRNGSRSASVTF